MIGRTLLTTTALTAVTAVAASAADAPLVSEQHFVAGKAPLTIPGTGVGNGEYMGAKAQLVFRDVTLEGDQAVRVTLSARNGREVRGLAVPEGTKIAFRAIDRRYVGDRKVAVRATVSRRAGDDEVTGRIYALTR